MSSSTLALPDEGFASSTAGTSDEFSYRPMSMMAVIVFVLSLVSLVGAPLWVLLLLPVFTLLLGGLTIWKLSRARGEYGGMGLATTGMVFSLVALVGGVAYQFYLYQSETPKDFRRVSFVRDISAKAIAAQSGSETDRVQLQALDGQKIFLKGFMYPVEQQTGLRSFLLVKDSGTCCFGGEPAVTDMIGVYMTGAKTANFYSGRVSVAGTFRMNREFKGTNKMEPVFLIDGVSVSRSQSDFDPPTPLDLAAKPAESGASTNAASAKPTQPDA